MRWIQLAAELRRRKVFRTTGVYFVAVFGVSQGAAELMPLFGAPEWTIRALVVGLVALTPAVILLAWRFDIGAEGIVRDSGEEETAASREAPTFSDMPTLVSNRAASGCVRVAWTDAAGVHSVVYAGEFSLGRGGDCEVRILDPLVSRSHARVAHVDGVWTIRDLDSTNGTQVDGEKISYVQLPARSEIRLNDAGPTLALEVVAPGEDTVQIFAGEERMGGQVQIPVGEQRVGSSAATEGS